MTEPKMIAIVKLAAVGCAALLLCAVSPTQRWAAGIETASFRLSLSLNADAVRFRTAAFESGHSGLSFIFEAGR